MISCRFLLMCMVLVEAEVVEHKAVLVLLPLCCAVLDNGMMMMMTIQRSFRIINIHIYPFLFIR